MKCTVVVEYVDRASLYSLGFKEISRALLAKLSFKGMVIVNDNKIKVMI